LSFSTKNKNFMKLRSIFAVTALAATTVSAPAIAQVTSVNQLRDVQPTEWSYQAISNLISRYGCVAGYPDGTFRPGQPATRAELAALTNSCLDNITQFYTEADARTAASLRSEFAKELGATNARVSALEVRNEAKDKGVGSYLGAAVTLQRQGMTGGGKEYNDTIAGASVVSRIPVASLWGNSVSLRPYVNFAAGPNSEIGSSLGVLGTYDWSVSKSTLSDGSKVSNTNLYFGGGGQWALTNDGQSNRQASIGNGSQVIFVTGVERRLSDKFVAFGDLLWPTQNDGVRDASYSPVGRIGASFKF
jgi:hypothetical protein